MEKKNHHANKMRSKSKNELIELISYL